MQQSTFCSECYEALSKEQKKQFAYNTKLSRNIKLSEIGMGFIIGGAIGAASFGTGMQAGFEYAVRRSQKKHGYTNEQLNDFSIDTFNVHFYMLDDNRSRAVLDKFENKLNSKCYKKYILNVYP